MTLDSIRKSCDFLPLSAQKHDNTLYISIHIKRLKRAHLYDPVQHDGKDYGDEPRKDVADDRGDSSIVTGKLGHHLEMSKKVVDKVDLQRRRKVIGHLAGIPFRKWPRFNLKNIDADLELSLIHI